MQPKFSQFSYWPMWITMKTALRTIPYIRKAKFLKMTIMHKKQPW